MTPFASPIYAFESLRELVWSFLTIAESKSFSLSSQYYILILIVAHELMTDAGVLHQDVSVNNLMIAPDMIRPPPVPPVTPLSDGAIDGSHCRTPCPASEPIADSVPVPLVTPLSVTTCTVESVPTIAATSGDFATPIPAEPAESRRGYIVDFDYAKLLTKSASTCVGTVS